MAWTTRQHRKPRHEDSRHRRRPDRSQLHASRRAAVAADRRPLPAAFHRNAVEQHAIGVRHGRRRSRAALGTPLNYVRGRPGEEVYLTFRNIGGSGLFYKKDRLFLQFRKGRLAGWKGDWGHNWMWQ
jgi:hypothetical protein